MGKKIATELRWSTDLRDKVKAAAARNRRSANSEILARLEASLAADQRGEAA